ncbi:hypothetical protein [robinz microvirus RP_139]|nr:hypothetical protein [robinz microvirus RP_139]
MAKSGRRRDNNFIATRRVHSSSPSFRTRTVSQNYNYSQPRVLASRPAVDDRRVWHPLGDGRIPYRYDSRPATFSTHLRDAPSTAQVFYAPKPGKTRLTASPRSNRPTRVARGAPTFSGPSQTKAIVVFQEPEKVPLCRARKVRERVLHALNVTGGRGRTRKPRFTSQSELHC